MKDAKRTGKGGAHSNGYVISRDLTPSLVPLADCKPMGRETRKHTPQQINKLVGCLRRFGFVVPIVLDAGGLVFGGSGNVTVMVKELIDQIQLAPSLNLR